MTSPFVRPSKPVSAAALIGDGKGGFLIVKPWYRDYWLLPGGMVEPDESPHAGCEREVIEELGLRLPIGHALCVDYHTAANPHGEGLQFVFDGGVLSADLARSVHLQAAELTDWRFAPLDEALTLLSPRVARRIPACLRARAASQTFYLEDGAEAPPDMLHSPATTE